MEKKIEKLNHIALKKSSPKTLADQAYELLEEKLTTLQLEPGSIVSEAVLVKELSIGRTPVREALQKLAQVGLVVIMPHKGILVSEINPLKQLKLLEMRQALEEHMVRSAAKRRSDSEKLLFQELADVLDHTAGDNNPIDFMRYDNIFHVLIAQATSNEYFCRAMELYNSLSRRFWYMHNKTTADIPRCSSLHADLARKIADGDPEEAALAHNRLIDYLVEITRDTLTF